MPGDRSASLPGRRLAGSAPYSSAMSSPRCSRVRFRRRVLCRLNAIPSSISFYCLPNSDQHLHLLTRDAGARLADTAHLYRRRYGAPRRRLPRSMGFKGLPGRSISTITRSRSSLRPPAVTVHPEQSSSQISSSLSRLCPTSFPAQQRPADLPRTTGRHYRRAGYFLNGRESRLKPTGGSVQEFHHKRLGAE